MHLQHYVTTQLLTTEDTEAYRGFPPWLLCVLCGYRFILGLESSRPL